MVPSCKKIDGNICFLRPMTEGDVPRWTKWFSDPTILEYSVHRTAKTNENKQLSFLYENNKDPLKLQLAICAPSKELLGVISMQFKDATLYEGDISIIIGEKSYWGKGIATDAISVLVKYVSTHYDTKIFTAGCDIRNKGSERSFLKCGFSREGVIVDAISYSDEDTLYDMIKLGLHT